MNTDIYALWSLCCSIMLIYPRHNICHTSPPTEDGPADLPAEIPLSAPANFRHLSLQEFHTDKAEVEVETCGRYKHFSSEESSRHSSTSSQPRGGDEDRDDGDEDDGEDDGDDGEHGDDGDDGDRRS